MVNIVEPKKNKYLNLKYSKNNFDFGNFFFKFFFKLDTGGSTPTFDFLFLKIF